MSNAKKPVLESDVEKNGWYLGTNRQVFGQAVPHFLSNESKDPFKYIMVGERIYSDEVVYANDA